MSKIDIVIRIALAIILGGVIGLERQTKHRPAGFRTYILVCVGSAAIMILSELLFRAYHAEFGIISDPARLGAQVISGVGFLGAGTIIHQGPNVKGLTTAASLWVVAAIGLTVGSGFYFLAIITSICIYSVLFIFNKIYKRIENTNDISGIMVELYNNSAAIGEINLLLARNSIKIVDMEFIHPEEESDEIEIIYLQLVIKMNHEVSIYTLMEDISRIIGIIKVERI